MTANSPTTVSPTRRAPGRTARATTGFDPATTAARITAAATHAAVSVTFVSSWIRARPAIGRAAATTVRPTRQYHRARGTTRFSRPASPTANPTVRAT